MSYFAREEEMNKMDTQNLPDVLTGQQASDTPIIQSTPDYVFRTESHPEANGRQPEPTDKMWAIRFPLEDGKVLEVQVGWAGMANVMAICHRIELDEALEAGGFTREQT
jgi:hypothetical protein